MPKTLEALAQHRIATAQQLARRSRLSPSATAGALARLRRSDKATSRARPRGNGRVWLVTAPGLRAVGSRRAPPRWSATHITHALAITEATCDAGTDEVITEPRVATPDGRLLCPDALVLGPHPAWVEVERGTNDLRTVLARLDAYDAARAGVGWRHWLECWPPIRWVGPLPDVARRRAERYGLELLI